MAKQVSKRVVFLWSVVAVVAVLATARADMTVRAYDAARHDRYYSGADKAFLGNGLDWSGVGRTAGGRWGTMISPSYFLTAYHYQPSGTLTFYETDSTALSHDYSIASLSRIGTTDLCLGRLATPLDPADNIAYYPILTAATLGEFLGRILYNVGQPFRVGSNEIDDFQFVSAGGSTTLSMLYDYDNNDIPGVGGDETLLAEGDSGGPSFVTVDGQLGLGGIHWFIYDDGAGHILGSGDSFVPAYASVIATAMSGESPTLMLVPEPGTWLLCLGGTGLLLRRRRRRSA